MSEMRTFQTRLRNNAANAILDAYAELSERAERTLFAKLQAKQCGINLLKQEFIARFGLTARQFNAIYAQVKGKISSIQELRAGRIASLERKIERAEKVLKRLTKPIKIHHKKRRLDILKHNLEQLQSDDKNDRIALCFGSRPLFHAQFNLPSQGCTTLAEWKTRWRDVRSSQFMVLGSKDETGGCQGCVARLEEDGSISLRLRLPNAILGADGTSAALDKYLVLSGLRFNYGHDALVVALGRNVSADKRDWVAISYRFCRDAKGWRVFATTKIPVVPVRSIRQAGRLGVDLNADHLAVTQIDRNGNPVHAWRIPCDTRGKSTAQRNAVIGEAVKAVIALASTFQLPIAIEKLNFDKKKAESEHAGVRRNRMLSGFAYARIQAILRARAYDVGIEICEVNPAWTSVIGEHKFAARYGLSRHTAAALIIGRRSMGLSERLPSQLQGTSCKSVRKRREHVWSAWARVACKLQAAHAAPEGPKRRKKPPRSPPISQETPMDDLPF